MSPDTPTSIYFAQALFMLAGVVPVVIGYRQGLVRSGGVQRLYRENISFPLIWAGLAIWSAGVVFWIAVNIIWFSVLALIPSVAVAVGTAAIYWMAARVQGRIHRGEIHDHDDELRTRQEDR